MYKFAVAVPTFNKAGVFWDLQPDTWVSQRAFATIAGDPIGIHDPGLWRVLAHLSVLGWAFGQYHGGYAQEGTARQEP